MTYTLIGPDETVVANDNRVIIYLGGNCRGRDWRLEFYRRFANEDVMFVTPRRDAFADPEMDPISHANQVGWERQAIDKCHIAAFWLGEGLSNQAARVEIGYAIGRGRNVLIGAADGFLGVEHLAAFSGMVLSSTVEGLINRVVSVVQEMSRTDETS